MNKNRFTLTLLLFYALSAIFTACSCFAGYGSRLRIRFMKGGHAARWVDENMADTFLVKAQAYIKDHRDKPFFLYYALQQPHVPRTQHERFVGETSMGPRGDVIVEANWCIGQLMRTLEE